MGEFQPGGRYDRLRGEVRYLRIAVVCFVIAALIGAWGVTANCQERTPDRAPAPAPAPAPGFKLSAAVLAGLAAVDTYQTASCVGAGRCREINPLYRGVAGSPAKLAALKAGITGGAIAGAWGLYRAGHKRQAWLIMGAALGAQSIAVISNTRQLRRARGVR